jgi:hypothetical protein
MNRRRDYRFNLESLEGKTVPSHLATGALGARLAQVALRIERADRGAVAFRLTTNQQTYTPGQTVEMTFTETNVSNHAVRVALGPAVDGFVITQSGRTVWRSNSGSEPLYIARRVLHSGQSITLTASWTVGSDTGVFRVRDQLAPSGPFATFNVVPNPSPTSVGVAQHGPSAGAPVPVKQPAPVLPPARPFNTGFTMGTAPSSSSTTVGSPFVSATDSGPSTTAPVLIPYPNPVLPPNLPKSTGIIVRSTTAGSPFAPATDSGTSTTAPVLIPYPNPVLPPNLPKSTGIIVR